MHITDCLANSNFAEVEEPLPEMPKAEPAPKKDMFNWKPASVGPYQFGKNGMHVGENPTINLARKILEVFRK